MMTADRLAESQSQSKTDVRCKYCGHLFFKATGASGRIEIVCPDRRCRRYQERDLPNTRR